MKVSGWLVLAAYAVIGLNLGEEFDRLPQYLTMVDIGNVSAWGWALFWPVLTFMEVLFVLFTWVLLLEPFGIVALGVGVAAFIIFVGVLVWAVVEKVVQTIARMMR